MSTRPRITFDDRGRCSACQWADLKKQINWAERREQLSQILNSARGRAPYDCLIAVSGGKDGSYVSHNLKKHHGMNPLTVTVRPGLETPLGMQNLSSFINSGYSNILISPDPTAMRILNRVGLNTVGFSYFGWLIAIHSCVLRTALLFDIPLIFYSEDGECEYGGDMKHANNGVYGVDYMLKNYMEGGYEKVLAESGLSAEQLYWFTMPSQAELDSKTVKVTHYGYYESWDPYRNYQVAKEHCGLAESTRQNIGTYTNFAQTDQDLYPLHVYLMYLKFGFGRATQDAGIDVRRGAMTRDQAVQLVRLYDYVYPSEYFDAWCAYYNISLDYLFEVFDRWANPDLFFKSDGIWKPTFMIE